MINLSYSTLNLIYEHPHNYLNKIMGLKQPENPYFANGKRLHAIIQKHVSGKEPHKLLHHIGLHFPIVEEVDFDPNCRIEFTINSKYRMIGYFDGADFDNHRILEIKTGTMWSVKKYFNSIQRRIYNVALPKTKENILITAIANEELWHVQKPNIIFMPTSTKDKDIVMDWIAEGINRMEHIKEWKDKELEASGGVCVDPRCYWGANCSFKQ